jgi:hypothetical protein
MEERNGEMGVFNFGEFKYYVGQWVDVKDTID